MYGSVNILLQSYTYILIFVFFSSILLEQILFIKFFLKYYYYSYLYLSFFTLADFSPWFYCSCITADVCSQFQNKQVSYTAGKKFVSISVRGENDGSRFAINKSKESVLTFSIGKKYRAFEKK